MLECRVISEDPYFKRCYFYVDTEFVDEWMKKVIGWQLSAPYPVTMVRFDNDMLSIHPLDH